MKSLRLACCLLVLSIFLLPSLTAQAGSDNAAAKDQIEQGQQALKAGKYKDAIDLLSKANASQGSSCGECYLLMAVAYYKSGKFSESMENSDRAVAAASDDKMRATAHSLKGNALFTLAGKDAKKMGAAEVEFRSAVQLSPKSPLLHLSLAKTLLWESKDDEAKQELEACLALNADEKLASEARFLLADPRRAAKSLRRNSRSKLCRVTKFR